MKHFTKLLSAMLALLLLISAMAFVTSCKKNDAENENDTVGTTATDDNLPALETKNLGGMEIAMLWPNVNSDGHFIHNELDVETVSTGDVIDLAVRNRNSVVETTYNVRISTVLMSHSKIPTTVKTEGQAGESSYQAIATTIGKMTPIAQEGWLENYNNLEYYSESQTWWNHSLMQDFAIANARYFGSGDIIYSDDLYPYTTFVNNTVVDQYGIEENFHELVKTGQWTLEKFHNIAKYVASPELDGDPDKWSEADMNGALMNPNMFKAIYYSAGKGMLEFDKSGYPIWAMTVEHTQPILEKAIAMVFNDGACLNTGALDGNHAEYELNLFVSGRSLFLCEELILAERITKNDASTDYTVLPFPKYEEESEYISVLNNAVVISVPVMAENKNEISLILSAMGRESINTLTPAFFETVLTYRYMQNPESVESLEIILASTKAPDVATIQDWGGFMAGYKALAEQSSTNFSSFHTKNIGTAMGALEEYSVLLDNYYKNKN